jgi:ATP-dependent RNA helicase RhlB
MFFKELTLSPGLQRGIAERGYTEMTPVQEQTLAETLQGLDVAVQSQTGTGKTAAFLITLFEKMPQDRSSNRKKALIIVPTRELAVQIEGEARLLNRHLGLRIGAFFGGVNYSGQQALLKKGVDIIIGTPGRLLDFSERGQLNLHEIGFLVIDEADRLFDMGFMPDLRKLFQKMPPRSDRQSMLFSATLNRLSRKIAAEYLNRPIMIELTPEQLTVDTISQELYHVKSHIKPNLLLGILQKRKPRNALIFTNMRHSASRLAKKLEANGLRCRYLTGDLPQSQRLKVIDDFTAGKFPFLVATDVAARGLHIDKLEMVINYDLPQDIENYVHRIGRTARAGNSGKAISLACERYRTHLDDIESFIGMKIPVQTAEAELFVTDMGFRYGPENREHAERSRRPHQPRQNGSGRRNRSSSHPSSGRRELCLT